MHTPTLLALLTGASLVLALPPKPHQHAAGNAPIKCPIILDGRIKTALQLADFDSYSTSPFKRCDSSSCWNHSSWLQ